MSTQSEIVSTINRGETTVAGGVSSDALSSACIVVNGGNNMLALKRRLVERGMPENVIRFINDDDDDDVNADSSVELVQSSLCGTSINDINNDGGKQRLYRSYSTASTVTSSSASSSSLYQQPEQEEEKKNEHECFHKIQLMDPLKEKLHVVDVKTLIWEVKLTQKKSSSLQTESIFVVTACRLDDKVEVKKLRQVLETLYNEERTRLNGDLELSDTETGTVDVESISFAPTQVAETISGYPSGSIPPIGYAQRNAISRLIVDSNIFAQNSNVEETSSQSQYISVGSGVLSYSMILPIDCVVSYSKNESHGLTIGSIGGAVKSDDRSKGILLNSEDGDNGVTHMDGETARIQRKIERMGRQPKPKDRLKEYRKMKDLIEKAKLLRTTARKKGRYADMKSLVQESIIQGDFPGLFDVQPEEGFSKNCLHLAAWRGDFETVQLLVETAQSLQKEGKFDGCDLDIVNIVSRGDGNYGKTAIFYALTQCREDVVRYLVSTGANLLLVNNKGQTPCSIAVSHMNDDVCSFLFEEEARQLKAGGVFTNYRLSNSDRKLYGDLDPRFPIDDDNNDADIRESIEQFHRSVSLAEEKSIVGNIPTFFEPRSLRPTVRWWNRPENTTLAEIQLMDRNRTYDKGRPITFTQQRELSTKKQAQLGDTDDTEKEDVAPALIELPFYDRDVEAMDVLTTDVLLAHQNRTDGQDLDVLIVNDTESIIEFAVHIDEASRRAGTNEHTNDDMAIISTVWGLDCEWKPGFDRGKDNPVATLQLSTMDRAYLIDVQSICQFVIEGSTEDAMLVEPTDVETRLDSALSKLFSDKRIPLIGFGVLQDLGKLAASFPHLSCFLTYNSVVDLQVISSVTYAKSTKPLLSSLQRMVALLLGKRLDKTQQCSDWTARPLSAAQQDYAVLDAAVLPLLLKTMLATSPTVARYNGQFFLIHEGTILSNLRYQLLSGDGQGQSKTTNPEAINDSDTAIEALEWHVPMGNVRTMFGRKVARQVWHTNQPIPALPKLVPVKPHRMTKKEALHIAKVGDESVRRPKPIQLRTLSGNLENLPVPGTALGYTKDSCVHRVIGHNFMNSLPERTHIGFNRRSGVVETNNAWIVFCNFGSNSTKKHYQHGRQESEFHDNGRFLTFTLKSSTKDPRSSEKTLLNHVLSSSNGNSMVFAGTERKILLFIRDGTSSKFLYCGECQCRDHNAHEGRPSVDLILELLDFDVLTGIDRVSNTFPDLVQWRKDVYSS